MDEGWASHPSETLQDWLEENPGKKQEFYQTLWHWGWDIDQYLEGRPDMAISPLIASKLEELGCADRSFWLRREALYRAKLAGMELR